MKVQELLPEEIKMLNKDPNTALIMIRQRCGCLRNEAQEAMDQHLKGKLVAMQRHRRIAILY